MRGQTEILGLLHDLVLGGVQVEVTTTPFNWHKPPTPRTPMPIAAAAPVEPTPTRRPVIEPGTIAKPAPLPPAPRREVPQVQAAATAGSQPGGVAVACALVPSPAELALLANMLKAVGLAEAPRAIVVGNAGVAEALRGQTPSHVLVLGQAPLSGLVGKTLGVEEWQRAPSTLMDNFAGPVGVTYPLELLLKNPLYKKRAWQHLLKWTTGD